METTGSEQNLAPGLEPETTSLHVEDSPSHTEGTRGGCGCSGKDVDLTRPGSTPGRSIDPRTIPMTSVRVFAGHYEVLGTSHAVEVIYGRGYWYLQIDGDRDARIGPFKTKREALQFCQASPEL